MTRQEFLSLVESKIVILDGATGSNLQKRGMSVGICPEQWMLENPQIPIRLQEEFMEAGSEIILAPTFTANRIKLAEYGLEDRIGDLNRELVALSRKALQNYRNASGDLRNVYIAADISMTGEQVYPLGTLTFEKLITVYKEQIKYILQAGVDLFVIETMMSLQECRAALLAVKESCDLPVIVSLTYNDTMHTIYGTDPKTAAIVLQSMGADAIGVNCSTGPDKIQGIVRELKEFATIPVMAKPNAGMPQLIEGKTVFPMDPEEFAEAMEALVELGANIIGGCCGSTPEHIRRMTDRVKGKKPVQWKEKHHRALTTERKTVLLDMDGRFYVVGERINPTGKTELQKELRAGDYSMVIRMAEEQVELGADFLDINVGMNGIDLEKTMTDSIYEVTQVVQVPLCIDSSNIQVMEAALRQYPGRALMNSISLEKEKFEKLIPIAKKYGAMFILLPLSDRGLPKNMEEKKQIISTIINRALELGLTKEDIIVDGLVNTVGANRFAALEAMETIRYCKEELEMATIVGLSNISFGLPERQFVNSTFLSFAIQAGLTMAIANPSQDLLMNTALAADLLRGKEDASLRYIDRVMSRPEVLWSGKQSRKEDMDGQSAKKQEAEKTEPDGRNDALYVAVVKGNRNGIIALVEKELAHTAPDQIIEQMLIPGITEVGRLYETQQYFLPQLIAGAEAMKKAIDYLEPKLSKKDQNLSKGTIVIATVKGDIHDIGKNLVALMLKNYGYHVIDLGKDVPTQKIIQTAQKENADIIALSALMTTTMVEMKNVVSLAKREGLKAKIIIGGAVITESYRKEIGADGFSEDAQSAVKLVQRLLTN
jgi:5-methyltetrahydrofolate--homocysteine methyltransferase